MYDFTSFGNDSSDDILDLLLYGFEEVTLDMMYCLILVVVCESDFVC